MGLSGTLVDTTMSQLQYFAPRLPQESKMSFSQLTLSPADTSICLDGSWVYRFCPSVKEKAWVCSVQVIHKGILQNMSVKRPYSPGQGQSLIGIYAWSCSCHLKVNQMEWVSDYDSTVITPYSFRCQSSCGQLENGSLQKSVTTLSKSTV